MGPLWGLLHPQILIDALPTHPYLSSNGDNIDLCGREVMDLLVASDAFLVKLEAFGFQMLPHAGLEGEQVALPPPLRGHRLAFEPGS
jgi:hypothetical protein